MKSSSSPRFSPDASRKANLHSELLGGEAEAELYAIAYRPVGRQDESSLDIWNETLTVGGTLPTLPLWLRGGPCLPLDLESTYEQARTGDAVAGPAIKAAGELRSALAPGLRSLQVSTSKAPRVVGWCSRAFPVRSERHLARGAPFCRMCSELQILHVGPARVRARALTGSGRSYPGRVRSREMLDPLERGLLDFSS